MSYLPSCSRGRSVESDFRSPDRVQSQDTLEALMLPGFVEAEDYSAFPLSSRVAARTTNFHRRYFLSSGIGMLMWLRMN